MKNKKGKAAQKKIEMIKGNLGLKKEYVPQKKEKDEVMTHLEKLNNDELVIQPMEKILCVGFKLGKCQKGAKCKFSHDPALLPKSKDDSESETEEEADKNTAAAGKKDDELQQSKHRNYTKIICKYFLEACEKKHYGHFWKCPNGLRCIYVHRLPAGFVLERDKKLLKEQQKEMEVDVTIEEFIEEELGKIQGIEGEKITHETFTKWKLEKKENEANEAEKENATKKEQLGKGKTEKLTGKELYELQANKDAFMSSDKQDASNPNDVFVVDKSREEIQEECEE